MDLDETWQVGVEKTKPCSLQGNREISERARKKWVIEVYFCNVYEAPLLPLSLDRFPPNLPRTRVQVVARDTWFHIPERFPLRIEFPKKPSF